MGDNRAGARRGQVLQRGTLWPGTQRPGEARASVCKHRGHVRAGHVGTRPLNLQTARGAAKSKAKRGEPGGKPPRLLSLGRAVGSINVAGKNPPVLHGQLPARECCPSYVTHRILFPNALHHGLYHECLNPLELLGVGSRINALSTRAGGSSYSHLWPTNPQQIPKTPKFTTSD